ncbi:TA2R9 protein, partial [Bucco capensis]|nr:TA2R9 protein [Bucco capensis]
DRFNATAFNVTVIIVITLQAFAGMWINAFIVCVLCTDWLKRKIFNSSEKILLFLGCSRFWQLCVTWLYYIFPVTYPCCFYIYPIPQLLAALLSFFDTSNVWTSACLCVFYCIKIANFRNTFFIYLKVKIDRIVPWLLLGSGLVSLVMGILSYATTDSEFNSTTHGILWKLNVRLDEDLLPVVFPSCFILTTALITVVFSALLLLFSLCRHKLKMQAKAVKDLSMDAHMKAVKSILSFLFIYSINFTGFVLAMIYETREEDLVTFLLLVFLCALPIFHSLILIFSNPKLEKTLLRILPCEKGKVC